MAPYVAPDLAAVSYDQSCVNTRHALNASRASSSSNFGRCSGSPSPSAPPSPAAGAPATSEEEDGSVTIPSYCDPEKPWGYRKPEEVKGVVTPTEQPPQEITKRDTKPVAGFELD